MKQSCIYYIWSILCTANLCDYINEDKGGPGLERLNEQGWKGEWSSQKQSSAEMQGFLSTARKVGSKSMHMALYIIQ